jgi:hypothetical protein
MRIPTESGAYFTGFHTLMYYKNTADDCGLASRGEVINVIGETDEDE